MPLVSVIVPSFNHAEFIAEAIESILAQTFSDLEIIVVDDFSSDETGTIISKYASGDLRIIPIFSEKNEGPGKARNKGIKISKGEYIAFCDADDVWEKKKIEAQLEIFSSNTVYDIVHSDSIIINGQGEQTGKKFSDLFQKGKKLTGDLFDELCLTNYINTQTVMMKKECIKSSGYFPEEIRVAEDWVFWVKIAARHKYYYIKEPLARYRIHEKSTAKISKIYTENRIKAIQTILERYPDIKNHIKSRMYYDLAMQYLEMGEDHLGRTLLLKSIKKDLGNFRSWGRLFIPFKF